MNSALLYQIFAKIKHLSLAAVLVCAAFTGTYRSHAADLDLPDLGGAGAGLVSPAQEYELGQYWSRWYRSQVQISQDPFMQTYTEDLIRNLATYSDLKDKRLDILLVNNRSLNAFAAPGGILGVHTGLFEYAQTEQQFASVLAHELAHLSQRHYARQIEESKNNQIPAFAALMASILIAATAGGEAGLAAMSVTQAAAIDSKLRFSRQMEQEADRVGMDTMVRSEMNPYAMGDMFDQMLNASRFQRRPPEFLLTHPLTESRVTDSQLRAQQYPRRYHAPNLTYQLVKVRAMILHQANPQVSIKQFKPRLDSNNKLDAEIARYGLALALQKANRLPEARKEFNTLLKLRPEHLHYLVGLSEIDSAEEKFDAAIARIESKHSKFPNHHALNVKLAEALMKAGRYNECETILLAHSKRHPKNDYVWYLLAEVHGLVGKIYDVHSARAEYFMLNGRFDKAIIQLKNALKLTSDNIYIKAKTEQRLKEARKMQKRIQEL
ncbi:MAG: peptidase M48 [Alteromonadaceae bacterium]|nr:MAG: peptidase M48 [Alteromonadaceae bacterium]